MRSWLNGGCRGLTLINPTLARVSDELGAVVAADVGRCWVEAASRLQHGHHVLGLATPPHSDRHAETAVYVDHIEEPLPPPIGAGVELEVHGPHLLQVPSLVSPHRVVGGTSPLLLSRSWELQLLFPP